MMNLVPHIEHLVNQIEIEFVVDFLFGESFSFIHSSLKKMVKVLEFWVSSV